MFLIGRRIGDEDGIGELLAHAVRSAGTPQPGRVWAYVGISMLGYVACLFLASILGEIVPALFMVVFGIALLAMLAGSVINAIRRLHDLGHTGWWMALFTPLQLVLVLAAYGEGEGSGYVFSGLQGLLGLGLLVWLGCIPGQPDANRFGPSPLAEPEAAAA